VAPQPSTDVAPPPASSVAPSSLMGPAVAGQPSAAGGVPKLPSRPPLPGIGGTTGTPLTGH
jgi:hypothetical protein